VGDLDNRIVRSNLLVSACEDDDWRVRGEISFSQMGCSVWYPPTGTEVARSERRDGIRCLDASRSSSAVWAR
jgi:hypothetical protein